MATDKTPSFVRGLLIPDPRFTFESLSSGSTYTENGPRPGIPEAQQSTDAVLQTSGTQTESTDIRIYTQSPGFPEDKGGSFLWYNATETTALKHFGWEPPLTINGIEQVENAAVGDYFRNLDCITTNDDTILIAGQESGSDSPVDVWRKSLTDTVWAKTEIATEADLEPGHTIVSGDFPFPGPALCKLPDGRILIFFWISLGTTPFGSGVVESWQIRAHSTSDDGANWTLYNEYCLTEPLQQLSEDDTDAAGGRYAPGRLRAAYKDGQILLLSSMYDSSETTSQSQPNHANNILGQWASSSLGASFDLVQIQDRQTGAYTGFDVDVSGSSFVVCWAEGLSPAIVQVGRVGSAYEPVLSSATVTAPGLAPARHYASGSSHAGDWDLSIVAAPDSSMYLVGVQHSTTADRNTRTTAAIVASYDRGLTWVRQSGVWDSKRRSDNEASGLLYLTEDHSPSTSIGYRDQLREVVPTWHRGRLVLACRAEKTDPAATVTDDYAYGLPDKAIHALYLGGYCNLPLGSINVTADMALRANYGKHWIPVFDPEDYGIGWVTNETGTYSAALEVDATEQPYLKITTGNGLGGPGDHSYSDVTLDNTDVRSSETTTSEMRTHVEFVVDIVQGGSVSTNEIALQIRNGTPTKAEKVSIRFERDGTSANVAIYDEVGTSQLDLTKLSNVGAITLPAEFRVTVHNRRIVVHARSYTAKDEARQFHLFYESPADALQWETVAGKYCELHWGGIGSGGDVTRNISYWYKVQAGSHDGGSADCAVPRMNDQFDFETPKNVGGRFLDPAPLYVHHGVKVAAKDGPANKADEWQIATRYDHPIESLHYELQPSPGKAWRSKDTSADAILTWNIDAANAVLPMGGTHGMYLGNINFRYATLEAYDGASWTTIADIDTAISCQYLRYGNTIKPDPASIGAGEKSPHFLTYDCLNGASFDVRHGSTTPEPRIIGGNSEGVFNSATTKQPVLMLDGNLSGMPTNGAGAIWAKEICVLTHATDAARYQKIRLTIPATEGSIANGTADGYWRIGVAVWGHLAAFGRQYSHGHIRGIENNVEVFTAKGGQRRAVKYGPPRRSVEFSWSDSMDLSQIQGTEPVPDYIKTTTTAGRAIAASVADAPFLVQGLITALDGPKTPVIYLPSIDTNNAGSTRIVDPNRMLYGRIVSAQHRIENQIGEEWAGDDSGEVVTATAIRIESEI